MAKEGSEHASEVNIEVRIHTRTDTRTILMSNVLKTGECFVLFLEYVSSGQSECRATESASQDNQVATSIFLTCGAEEIDQVAGLYSTKPQVPFR